MASHGAAIYVNHIGDAQFHIQIRGHELTVDQPRLGGGEDAGPTPTEVFVASLAACAAFFGRGFLHARGLPDAISVRADWGMDIRPSRVTHIHLVVDAPALPRDRREAFGRAIEHCTVHNSILEPPQISFELAAGESDASAAS